MTSPSASNPPVKIAVVGCGAISQTAHLPALKSVPELECAALVDPNLELARKTARRYGISAAAASLDEVLDRVQAVLVAAPNHLHAELALAALSAGKAVLCEKPLAIRSADALRMSQAARNKNAFLAAAMICRQYPGFRSLRETPTWGKLGKIAEVRAEYGYPLDWPAASSYLFDRQKAGGGALIDQGSHLLDVLFWTLSVQRADVVEYGDDGESGLEAECEGRLSLRSSLWDGDLPCAFRVSRLRRLANRVELIGERGRVQASFSSEGENPFASQLMEFAAGAAGRPCSLADAESQVRTLRCIEACYAARRPLTRTWEAYAPVSS